MYVFKKSATDLKKVHISLLRTMMKMERKKGKRNVIFSQWIILVPLLLDLTQLFLFAPRSKTRPSWANFFAFRTSLLSFSVTIWHPSY